MGVPGCHIDYRDRDRKHHLLHNKIFELIYAERTLHQTLIETNFFKQREHAEREIVF
jgi:hypothetical protein